MIFISKRQLEGFYFSPHFFQHCKNRGHKKKKQKQRQKREKQEDVNESQQGNVPAPGEVSALGEIDDGSVADSIHVARNRGDKKVNGTNPGLASYDLDTVWQDYWGKYGDYLVWQGWVEKYPDQINYDNTQSVPAIAEIEIDTIANVAVTDVNLAETSGGMVDGADNIGKEDKVSEQSSTEQSTEKCINISKAYSRDETNGKATHQNNTSTFLTDKVPSSSKYKTVSGSAIVETLQKRTEGYCEQSEATGSDAVVDETGDNQINERNEMFNMLHSYSSHTAKNESTDRPEDHKDLEDVEDKDCSENTKVENYPENVEGDAEAYTADDEAYKHAWEELWNEHYTVSYWYYFNQFTEKFNRIAWRMTEEEEATVVEGIAVVNDDGELVVMNDDANDMTENNTIENSSEAVSDDVEAELENVQVGLECDSNPDNVVYVIADPDNPDGFVDLESMNSEELVKLTEDIVSCLNGVDIKELDKGLNIKDTVVNKDDVEEFVREVGESNSENREVDMDDDDDDDKEIQALGLDNPENTEEPTDGNSKKRKKQQKHHQTLQTSQNSAFSPYNSGLVIYAEVNVLFINCVSSSFIIFLLPDHTVIFVTRSYGDFCFKFERIKVLVYMQPDVK